MDRGRVKPYCPPMSLPPRPRLWLLALLVLGVVAVGVGLAVHASRDSAPGVLPYDPLPRW